MGMTVGQLRTRLMKFDNEDEVCFENLQEEGTNVSVDEVSLEFVDDTTTVVVLKTEKDDDDE